MMSLGNWQDLLLGKVVITVFDDRLRVERLVCLFRCKGSERMSMYTDSNIVTLDSTYTNKETDWVFLQGVQVKQREERLRKGKRPNYFSSYFQNLRHGLTSRCPTFLGPKNSLMTLPVDGWSLWEKPVSPFVFCMKIKQFGDFKTPTLSSFTVGFLYYSLGFLTLNRIPI